MLCCLAERGVASVLPRGASALPLQNISTDSLPQSIGDSVLTASDITEIESIFAFDNANGQQRFGDIPIRIVGSSSPPEYPDRNVGFQIADLDEERYHPVSPHVDGHDRMAMLHKRQVSSVLGRNLSYN